LEKKKARATERRTEEKRSGKKRFGRASHTTSNEGKSAAQPWVGTKSRKIELEEPENASGHPRAHRESRRGKQRELGKGKGIREGLKAKKETSEKLKPHIRKNKNLKSGKTDVRKKVGERRATQRNCVL